VATPRKRAAGGTPAKSGSPQKKMKAKILENNTDDDSEAEKQALKEVRQELEEQKK
jgi:hypothetical protein